MRGQPTHEVPHPRSNAGLCRATCHPSPSSMPQARFPDAPLLRLLGQMTTNSVAHLLKFRSEVRAGSPSVQVSASSLHLGMQFWEHPFPACSGFGRIQSLAGVGPRSPLAVRRRPFPASRGHSSHWLTALPPSSKPTSTDQMAPSHDDSL